MKERRGRTQILKGASGVKGLLGNVYLLMYFKGFGRTVVRGRISTDSPSVGLGINFDFIFEYVALGQNHREKKRQSASLSRDLTSIWASCPDAD